MGKEKKTIEQKVASIALVSILTVIPIGSIAGTLAMNIANQNVTWYGGKSTSYLKYPNSFRYHYWKDCEERAKSTEKLLKDYFGI